MIVSGRQRYRRNAPRALLLPIPPNEVSILARVFDDERGLLSPELARSIMDVNNDRDKARMHDLAVRNQAPP